MRRFKKIENRRQGTFYALINDDNVGQIDGIRHVRIVIISVQMNDGSGEEVHPEMERKSLHSVWRVRSLGAAYTRLTLAPKGRRSGKGALEEECENRRATTSAIEE